MAEKTKKKKAGKAASQAAVGSPVKKQGIFRRVLRLKPVKWVLRVLIILCLLPFLLTLIYKIEATRPISTLMLGGYASLNKVERKWVSIDDVAPVLINSVMMSEDGQFCAHNGVDWAALNQVIDDALEGEKTRGASTLTMQTAKNLFLWNSRSYIRKGIEVPLALYLDAVLAKRRIMEIYLNIAEWGKGIYGIEAASKHYFGRSAKKLSRNQAALLAVTLPNPKVRNPNKPTKSLRRVANVVQKRAQKAGAYVKCINSK